MAQFQQNSHTIQLGQSAVTTPHILLANDDDGAIADMDNGSWKHNAVFTGRTSCSRQTGVWG